MNILIDRHAADIFAYTKKVPNCRNVKKLEEEDDMLPMFVSRLVPQTAATPVIRLALYVS
jgi:hypothetical protein